MDVGPGVKLHVARICHGAVAGRRCMTGIGFKSNTRQGRYSADK